MKINKNNSILLKNSYIFLADEYDIYDSGHYIHSYHKYEDILHDIIDKPNKTHICKYHIFIKNSISVLTEDLIKRCDLIARAIYVMTGKKTILHIDKSQSTFLKKMYLENKKLGIYDCIQFQIDSRFVRFKDGYTEIVVINSKNGPIVKIERDKKKGV